MCSAKEYELDTERLMEELDISQFLVKPFSPSEIVKLARSPPQTELVGEVRGRRQRPPVIAQRRQPAPRTAQEPQRRKTDQLEAVTQGEEPAADQAHVVVEGKPADHDVAVPGRELPRVKTICSTPCCLRNSLPSCPEIGAK